MSQAVIDSILKELEDLKKRITALEKNTSLFHETYKVPEGWCQICGMEKRKCVHGI